jgi:hypothetical protein
MFEQTFKNIDDILHKDAGCTSELDYTEQSSWLLFLKYLDALEAEKATEAVLEGRDYRFILDERFRWGAWAAPKGADGKIDHNAALTGDDLKGLCRNDTRRTYAGLLLPCHSEIFERRQDEKRVTVPTLGHPTQERSTSHRSDQQGAGCRLDSGCRP